MMRCNLLVLLMGKLQVALANYLAPSLGGAWQSPMLGCVIPADEGFQTQAPDKPWQ
jgi:hypothetical protein